VKKILFVLVVLFSAPVFAEYTPVEECAKWLIGDNQESAIYQRYEAAVLCARGSTIECAKWVLGNQPNNYNNRVEAVKACATRGVNR